jgi:hypothetical protein
MPDQDENQPYLDAIANLRETTKWIIASAAGLAAFLIGSNPLSGLNTLAIGWPWWVAAGSSLASILLTVGILWFAIPVVSSMSMIGLDPLVHDAKYWKHRGFLETHVTVYFPPNIRTLQALRTVYIAARDLAIQRPIQQNIDALQVYQRYVRITLQVARWLEVTYRFRDLLNYFILAIIGIVFFVYIFIWVTNSPKDKSSPEPRVALTLMLTPAGISGGNPPPNSPTGGNPPPNSPTGGNPPPNPSTGGNPPPNPPTGGNPPPNPPTGGNPPPNPPTGGNPPNSPTRSDAGFDCGDPDNALKVGPFVTGDVKLEKGTTDVNVLLDRLSARRDHRALIGLILLGSADKTPLLPKLASQYGSNAGLAQARAEWVRSRLLQADVSHQLGVASWDKIATTVAGPARVGIDITPDALALDREVRVCAIWGAN